MQVTAMPQDAFAQCLLQLSQLSDNHAKLAAIKKYQEDSKSDDAGLQLAWQLLEALYTPKRSVFIQLPQYMKSLLEFTQLHHGEDGYSQSFWCRLDELFRQAPGIATDTREAIVSQAQRRPGGHRSLSDKTPGILMQVQEQADEAKTLFQSLNSAESAKTAMAALIAAKHVRHVGANVNRPEQPQGQAPDQVGCIFKM